MAVLLVAQCLQSTTEMKTTGALLALLCTTGTAMAIKTVKTNQNDRASSSRRSDIESNMKMRSGKLGGGSSLDHDASGSRKAFHREVELNGTYFTGYSDFNYGLLTFYSPLPNDEASNKLPSGSVTRSIKQIRRSDAELGPKDTLLYRLYRQQDLGGSLESIARIVQSSAGRPASGQLSGNIRGNTAGTN